MYDYIKGEISELNPTFVVLDNQGIGFHIKISLNTFSSLSDKPSGKLYIHEIIREDTHELYGFKTPREREVFRLLISVSGIGANTARMILSSLSIPELEVVLSTGDVNTLKGIKGIGLKTAQRVIVDLKDKIGSSASGTEILIPQNNTIQEEALSALVMLGFTKNASEKALKKVLSSTHLNKVEDIIKQTLKFM